MIWTIWVQEVRGVAKGGAGGGRYRTPQCRVRQHNKPVVGKMNWIKPIGNTSLERGCNL
jgi:hypothetical protein